MPARRSFDADAAETLLARGRAAIPAVRARFDALVAAVIELLPDPRRMREAGLALDEIARGKLYRLAGHATFDAFLRADVGISRAKAHRLRVIARAPATDPSAARGRMAAFEAARRSAKTHETKRSPRVARGAKGAAKALAARLRRQGIRGARVEVIVRGGETLARIELPIDDCDRLG